MSTREYRRRSIASAVMKEAWDIKKRTVLHVYNISSALRLAWMTVRSHLRFCFSKVRGSSYNLRQKLLRKLSACSPSDIRLSFIRETDNPHDSNAIQICAASSEGFGGCIGYVSRELAVKIAPQLDAGYMAVVKFEGITGTDKNGFLGCNYRFVIIEKAAYI